MLKRFLLTAALSVSTIPLLPHVALSQFAGSVYAPIDHSQTFTNSRFGNNRTVTGNPYRNPYRVDSFGGSSVYRNPYRVDSFRGNPMVIERDRFSDPFSSRYRNPRTTPQAVIVAPIIINPRSYPNGYSNGRRGGYWDSYRGGYYSTPSCGTAIIGSSIPSPIPVNPLTGIACR